MSYATSPAQATYFQSLAAASVNVPIQSTVDIITLSLPAGTYDLDSNLVSVGAAGVTATVLLRNGDGSIPGGESLSAFIGANAQGFYCGGRITLPSAGTVRLSFLNQSVSQAITVIGDGTVTKATWLRARST